ncbi:MAG: hypothetical protein M0Z52_02915 [Actinomycetota bacterium]|nr:hypothetical protein [Actinomycetota bacterium]
MLKPFSTTGIGSLPHTDPQAAVERVLSSFDIPFWPQLPRLSFREQMIPQYTEGLPFIRINEEKKSIWVSRTGGDELERFYESYNENTRIAISENFAEGLHAFLRIARNDKKRKFSLLKGHITGPLTFTLGLNDANGKPVYYDEEMREVYLMGLKAKARWQVDQLGALVSPEESGAGRSVIIFIDEPLASALGSTTYIAVDRAEALRLLSETVQAIKECGGLAGIHCCGRAEWPFLMESGADILNFDAYDYGETIAMYPAETKEFLEKGGYLALGIVPTTEAINSENAQSIKDVFARRIEGLARFLPEDLIKARILLTPACGTGSLSKAEAEKVFELLSSLRRFIGQQ